MLGCVIEMIYRGHCAKITDAKVDINGMPSQFLLTIHLLVHPTTQVRVIHYDPSPDFGGADRHFYRSCAVW